MKKRPHMIIFNPDEMRADALGHLGNPAAITPHLDHFAAHEAVSFRNAYCQNPVCVPSRCSFFTGLYPHVHGHRTMTHLLRPGETSLLKELKDAGYYVWMNDRNDLCAGQYPGWVEAHASEIFYPTEDFRTCGPVKPHMRGNPGDRYYYAHFSGELKTDANGENVTADDRAVDAAIERIRAWREGDAPLCIYLGLFYPHVPYGVEQPYFSAIDRAKLLPRRRWQDCAGKSRMMELCRGYQSLHSLTECEWDELRAAYYGMCMKVDAQFSRLCAALQQAGMYEDSAVFFFSDHGDFTGDYEMVEKAQNCFEDCLSKVPFLVKPPQDYTVDAGISDSLVELVDFYATAMEFADVTPSHTHFGKSLHPVLANRMQEIRQYAFCEGGRLPGEQHCDEYHQGKNRTACPEDEYWPKKMAQADDIAHAKAIMIRDRRYKYISRSAGQDELYDLLCDPGETINQIENQALAAEVSRLQIALMKWLQATGDVVPYDLDRRMTDEMLWNKVKCIVPPQMEQEVREKIQNGVGIGELFGFCARLQQSERTSGHPAGHID